MDYKIIGTIFNKNVLSIARINKDQRRSRRSLTLRFISREQFPSEIVNE